MEYLDTSLLVSAFCRESMSAKSQAWILSQDPTHLFVSDWTITEVSSALAVKLRNGEITQDERAVALARFHRLVAESIAVLPVTASHFRMAAAFADQHTLGLRSGDALHLAIAADHGATLQTLDRRLAQAGPPAGVTTHLLT